MKKNGFVSIALWLTLASVIGKVLGFLKDILISYYYGSSASTDAIFLALSIPTIILGVFTSSTDSAIIPQYNRLLHTKGREYADRNFSNIINLISLCGFIVSLVILFFPDIFIDLFAPGFNDVQRMYSEKYLRIFSFAGLFHILYCFFCSYTIRYKHVVTRAILSFLTNLLIVVIVIIWHDPYMTGLSIAYFVGSLISAILPLISAIRLKYKHIFYINLSDLEFKKYWHLFIPIMFGALLVDLNMFVDRFLASGFEDGSVSSLNYASRITAIFDSMIVIGIGVVILPLLSQQNVEGNKEKFRKITTLVFELLFIVLLPIMILGMYLSEEIIQLIYYRGKFDMDSVKIVAKLFFYYAPMILLVPLHSVCARFFHSLEDTKTPLKVTFIAVILNISLSIVLSRLISLQGIALATSISLILNVLLLLLYIYKKIGWDSTIMNWKTLSKIFCAILLFFVTLNCLNQFDLSVFWKVLLSCFSGGVSYVGCLYLLMKSDIQYIIKVLK